MHLSTGTDREEAMSLEGEEEWRRGVSEPCVMCVNGDRAAIGIDVDAQGISLKGAS